MIDLKLVHEHTKTLKVLYVEDNETLRESTLKVLENFFDVVEVAVDGLDGVDKYKTFMNSQEEPYDLVISDINMPHLNGVDMSKKILDIEPHQSIIFVTAHNEPEFLHQAISLGVSSFLLKPLSLQDLASVLFKVCRSISDRKLVEEHYKMMDQVNQQLENQNEALEQKNKEQAKLIRILDTMMAVKANTNNNKVEQSVSDAEEVSESVVDEKEASYNEQIQLLIEEDITELQEIHEALDADIISIISGREEYIPNLAELFSRYASILSMYSSFEALSAAMNNLVQAMHQEDEPKNRNNKEEIFNFLEAFMYILGTWQKDIINQKDEKINHLDVSIIGDLETITNLWLAEDVGEEVEFF